MLNVRVYRVDNEFHFLKGDLAVILGRYIEGLDFGEAGWRLRIENDGSLTVFKNTVEMEKKEIEP